MKQYYDLILDDRYLALTKREAQCMFYLLRGKTAKQTAALIHLSKKTVEMYLDILKQKTCSESKLELVCRYFLNKWQLKFEIER